MKIIIQEDNLKREIEISWIICVERLYICIMLQGKGSEVKNHISVVPKCLKFIYSKMTVQTQIV